MAKRYWTADLHLGHAGIVLYCGRPFMRREPGVDGFKSAEHARLVAERMNDRLIANINSRCMKEDTLIHVGDFCTKGVAQGIDGLRLKAVDYLRRINCKVVLLEGNHDKQNKTKTIGRHLFSQIQGRSVFVSHYPTENRDWFPELIDVASEFCDFAICGHVHERWRFKEVFTSHGRPTFLNVNVGCDQWKYVPISDDELMTAVNKYRREKALGGKGGR